MDDQEVSDSPLAWSWVIEALASSGNLDFTALHDLFKAKPSLADKMNKEAREMVTLKSLEALCGPVKVLNSCASLSHQKESILLRVLDKAAVSSVRRRGSGSSPSLRKGSSDKLKREVHAFIETKKASLPKCALEQLLENGNIFHDTCLRRERSSSPTQKRMQDCSVDVQSGKSPPEKKRRLDSDGSNTSTEQNSAALVLYDVSALSRKPAQSKGKLTKSPSDVSKEVMERHAESSSTSDDSRDLDICIKCNKGGEVLICRVNSCPVVVHKKCLGFSESIANKDDFLCPFCACSSAQSEYTEAKKKKFLTSQKLSLFVGGNPDQQSKEFTNVNTNPSRHDRDETLLKGKVVNQDDRDLTDKQHKIHSAQGNVYFKPPDCSSKGAENTKMKKCHLEKGKQSMPSEYFHFAGLHGGHIARDNLYTSLPNCSFKGGIYITAENYQLGKQPYILSKNPSCASYGNLNGTSETESHTANPSSNDLSLQSCPKLADQMKVASSSSLDDCGGTLVVAPISEYSLKSREKEAVRMNFLDQTLTGSCSIDSIYYSTRSIDRLMRICWTEEDSEMLKDDMKVKPWKSILEFGSSVFWKGRTQGNDAGASRSLTSLASRKRKRKQVMIWRARKKHLHGMRRWIKLHGPHITSPGKHSWRLARGAKITCKGCRERVELFMYKRGRSHAPPCIADRRLARKRSRRICMDTYEELRGDGRICMGSREEM